MSKNSEPQMHILHVTRQFYPAIGGIENVVMGICENSNSIGYKNTVITLNKLWEKPKIKLKQFEIINDIQIIRIPFLGFKQYAFSPSIIQYLPNYDLIHIHSSDFFLDYIALTQFIHKTPIILHSHGLYFHSNKALKFKNFYFHTLTKQALKHVEKIICVSNHDKNLLKDIAKEEKLTVIPNGLMFEKNKNFFHQRKKGLILSVGRLASNKRYHLLIEAFAHTLKSIPECELVIIGKNQGELTNLKYVAEKLGITSKVQFLGEVSNETLYNFLSTASIWTSASSYESFGVALLEAVAAGCIPVVQKLEAFNEYLTDNVNGFFTDFSNPLQASKDLINALNLNETNRNQIIEKGNEIACKFDWKNIIPLIDKVYRDIFNEGQQF